MRANPTDATAGGDGDLTHRSDDCQEYGYSPVLLGPCLLRGRGEIPVIATDETSNEWGRRSDGSLWQPSTKA